MRVAISYVRFSHDKQKMGESVRRQLDRTRAYCERAGLYLDETRRLADCGMSAFRGRHATKGKLAAFVEDVESGRVPRGSVLIVESLDRLDRRTIDQALPLFLRIIHAGVDVVTLDPERVHTQESVRNLTGLIEAIVIMSRSNEESERKSSRITDVWEQRRKAIRQGARPNGRMMPWWVDYDDVDRTYVLIPDRAAVVREIFDLRVKGYGCSALAKRLIARTDIPLPRRARAWNLRTVHLILTNRAAIGEFQPHKQVEGASVPEGDPIQGYYPPAVSPAVFHAAQESLKGAKKGREVEANDHINLFKGKLINGNDAQNVYCYCNHAKYTRKGKTYQYKYFHLMSRGARDNMPGADRARLKYDTFESAFLRYCKELKPSDFVRDGGDVAEETAEVTGQLAEVEHKIRFTRERIKGKPLRDVEHLFGLLDEFEGERKALAERLDALKAQASNQDVDAVGELRSLASMLDAADPDAARDLRVCIRQRIDQLIDSIVLYPVVRSARGTRVAYDCLVVVRFRDASQRWYVTDDTGNLKIGNLSLPQQGAEFDEFLRRLNQDVQVVFPS